MKSKPFVREVTFESVGGAGSKQFLSKLSIFMPLCFFTLLNDLIRENVRWPWSFTVDSHRDGITHRILMTATGVEETGDDG